jgi:chromosomal replication initiation ATPase DnaA
VSAPNWTDYVPDAVHPAGPLTWTPRRVLTCAAEAFDVNEKALLGHDLFHPLVWYRHVTIAAVRRFCELSYSSTARFFGRDHTTIIHSIKRVESDPKLSDLYSLLAERLLTEGMG